MREIEIKARVADVDAIIEKIKATGVELSEPIRQRDEVFGLPGDDGMEANNSPWLRIRTQISQGETKYIYTLKKSVTNQLDSIEHETEVADPDELRQIILQSGFEPYSDSTKTRRKVRIGEVEICIDDVEGLGTFVEAEKLTGDDADGDMVRRELWELLESFDVTKDSEITDGYDTLMKRAQQESTAA